MMYGPLSELLLDGRYRVGPLIGSGGFGHVYAALHVGLEGKVAIKVPRIDDLPARAIPEAVAKFLEEGRTLRRLRHPNLAAALDVALLPPDAEGIALPYLVLEWCDGVTLKDWRAARAGSMSPREVWAVLRPAFEAIAHAHDEGVAHRDLKPANVIVEVTRSGETVPRVIDFGIAKIVGEMEEVASGLTHTTSASRSFTPKYAAPEQLLGMRTGPWTDVYALALVLLEMVMGRQVFSSDEDSRRAVMESEPPTPRRLGLDLGPWNPVIERALSARPIDRFPDARAFMEALDAIGESSARATGTASSRASGERKVAPPADDSVAPASHTMWTSTTRGSSAAQRWRGPFAAAVGIIGVAGAVAFFVVRHVASPAPAPITSASVEPVPASPPPSLRPLSSMSPDELDARAAAGGMRSCVRTIGGPVLMLACNGGYVQLVDRSGGGLPIDLDALKRNQLLEAKLVAKGYGAARFTNDGGWTLLVTASGSMVDDVMNRVVADFRHDAIGADSTPIESVPVPARLARWTGRELVQRLFAVGASPSTESKSGNVHTVTFMVGSEGGSLQLVDGDPTTWLAATEKGPAHTFAVDGDVTITCFGNGPLGKLDFLRKVLGDTQAERFGQRP